MQHLTQQRAVFPPRDDEPPMPPLRTLAAPAAVLQLPAKCAPAPLPRARALSREPLAVRSWQSPHPPGASVRLPRPPRAGVAAVRLSSSLPLGAPIPSHGASQNPPPAPRASPSPVQPAPAPPQAAAQLPAAAELPESTLRRVAWQPLGQLLLPSSLLQPWPLQPSGLSEAPLLGASPAPQQLLHLLFFWPLALLAALLRFVTFSA
mmetsp:Transcript_144710/g.250529  ORF Transcript_144710/g.250529 Transcript_144710/m.250529 type:complete len:206 (+) Transcript_144710:37-654(+)